MLYYFYYYNTKKNLISNHSDVLMFVENQKIPSCKDLSSLLMGIITPGNCFSRLYNGQRNISRDQVHPMLLKPFL